MLRKYKQLVVGIIIGGIVASAGTAYAGKGVMVSLMNEIKFKFDGVVKSVPEGYSVLSYNGRTYVPARFVAEELDATVGWDAATSTVIIDSAKTKEAGTVGAAQPFNVDVNIISGPMRMKVSKVTLDPAYKKYEYSDAFKAVVLTVEVENTSDQTVHWHPAQGTLVLNTKEQAEAGMSMFYSDDVGGEFVGKVIKKGNIVVKVTSELSEIKNMNLKIDGAFDDSLHDLGEDTITDIVLK